MKPRILPMLLVFAFVLGTAFKPALAQDGPDEWYIEADAVSWFKTDDKTRGGAYNPATGNVLVATRTGGARIIVVDGATGDSLATLDMTGVTEGSYGYTLNEMATTSDGQIFAANLRIGTTAPLKIYHWADESAAPTVIYNGGPDDTGRFGDSFAAAGSGNDVRLYVSGSSNNPNVAKFSFDGTSATFDGMLAVTAGAARMGMIEHDGHLIVSGIGTPLEIYELSSGSLVATAPEEAETGPFGDIGLVDYNGMVAVLAYDHSDGSFTMLDITNIDAGMFVLKNSGPIGENENLNGTAFVTVDSESGTAYLMVSNNAILPMDLEGIGPAIAGYLDPVAWSVEAGSATYVGASTNATRSGAYNASTDHVLIATRTGGPRIIALDAATGDSVKTLDMTGITGGSYGYTINEMAVTADGQIFAANLRIASTGDNFKIYHWADEDSAPTVAYDGAPDDVGRFGDSFTAVGTGNEIMLFASGGGNEAIATFSFDGTTATLGTPISVPAGTGRLGLAGASDSDHLWANGIGTPLSLIDLATGNIVFEADVEAGTNGTGDVIAFSIGYAHYVAVGPDFSNSQEFYVYDASDVEDDGLIRIGSTPAQSVNANVNGTSFMALDTERNNFVFMASNNAISSTSIIGNPGSAPSAPVMLSPEDGALVVIEGNPYDEFTATWGSSVDAEGGIVSYAWALATGTSLDDVVLFEETGSDTSVTFYFLDVDRLLEDLGVAVGDTATVYHFAMASDGRFQSMGVPITARLARGGLNAAPGAASIISPADGASVTIGPDPNAEITVTWGAAEDADGDTLSYVWEISDQPTFGTVVHSVDAGRDTSFTVTAAAFDGVLAGAGIPLDTPYPLFHRVATSDGIETTYGAPATATFTRKALAEPTDYEILFAVDMSVAKLGGSFTDESVVVVAGGFNGWSTTTDTLLQDFQNPDLYTAFVSTNQLVPGSTEYKFVIRTGDNVGWESIANRRMNFVAADNGAKSTLDANGAAPYFDNVTPDQILTEESTFTFEVDARPIYYYLADNGRLPNDTQTGDPVESFSTLYVNGPLANRNDGLGDWATWGPNDLGQIPSRQLVDDGTAGDAVAGDSVFTIQMTFAAGTPVMLTGKYGTDGYDNEGGFGADHRMNLKGGSTIRTIYGGILQADGTIDDSNGPTNPEGVGDWDKYILISPDSMMAMAVKDDGDKDGDEDAWSTITDIEGTEIPTEFALHAAYPNPFNPSTQIRFDVAEAGQVTLRVFDLLGRHVATLQDGVLPAGQHKVTFEASNLPSGTYVYRMVAGGNAMTKTVVLLK